MFYETIAGFTDEIFDRINFEKNKIHEIYGLQKRVP